MSVFGYLLHQRDEFAVDLAQRRAVLVQLAQDRLPGADLELVEEAGSRLTPLLSRTAAAELDRRFTAGDNLLAFGEDLYTELPGFEILCRRWLDRGITLHLAELSDAVAPGTELAAVFLQGLGLAKWAMRKG